MEESDEKSKGFFKLPHAIFSDPVLMALSGEQFRLYLWLLTRAWRFPSSNGTVRASLSFIQLHIPISESTATRALKKLQELGLIWLATKDLRGGNTWFVKRPDSSLSAEQKDSCSKSASKCGGSSSSKNSTNVEELAESSIYPLIFEHLKKIHPKYLREEQDAFRELQSRLTAERLEEAFRLFVDDKKSSGQFCSCPLSYLNKLLLEDLKNYSYPVEKQRADYIENFSLQSAAEREFEKALFRNNSAKVSIHFRWKQAFKVVGSSVVGSREVRGSNWIQLKFVRWLYLI
jgi:hypothetical protein